MYTNPKDVREKKVEKFGNTPMTWIVILIVLLLLGLVAVPMYQGRQNPLQVIAGYSGMSDTSPLQPFTTTPI
jgi:hypothetical protein